MRLELHLFLWVTAGLAVLLPLSSDIWPNKEIPSVVASMRAHIAAADKDTSEIDAGAISIKDRLKSMDYDISVRPMFAVIAIPLAQVQVSLAPEAALPPVLKGVLGGADGRMAVFSRDAVGAEVVTVSPGEAVAEYRIEQIGEDFVTAVSPAGEEVRFELRGAGEGH